MDEEVSDSESSYRDEDSHDSEDEASYDDEEDESVLKDLKDSWKQHSVAVLIAVLATIAAHRFCYSTVSPSAQGFQAHDHLKDYQRLSHWSFCDSSKARMAENVRQNAELDLFRLDVPSDLVPALKRLYAADMLQDDSYEQVMSKGDDEIDQVTSSHPEIVCVDEQLQTKSVAHGWTYYYKSPSFESMYQQNEAKPQTPSVMSAIKQQKNKDELKPAPLTFTGFAAVFTNRSRKPVILYWDNSRAETAQMVGEIAPWDSLTTATTPGSSFFVTPVYDPSHALARWTVTAETAQAAYTDPDTQRMSELDHRWNDIQELQSYFQRDYLIASKRQYLSNLRPPPLHPYWSADFIGQTHQVDDGLTLQTASVTPRVMELENFLTPSECQQLVALSHEVRDFSPSTVVTGHADSSSTGSRQLSNMTRSSTNTWLDRHEHTLVDEIYKRASRIFQVDDSLLQSPPPSVNGGRPVHARYHALAESMQIVRYQEDQQYTAHHDFVNAPIKHRHQPLRFATLLVYLNDEFQGGQTRFPRAVNKVHHDGVTITPKTGKAVLFYNVLPDGNVDDLSQHAGELVTSGTKYAANIWLWEPIIH